METKIWDLRNHLTDDVNIDTYNEIKNVFEAGGLIAIPTETVYGLGGDARNEQTIENIYAAKSIPSDTPLIVHIHNVKQIEASTTHIALEVRMLMSKLWPSRISVIVPGKNGLLP